MQSTQSQMPIVLADKNSRFFSLKNYSEISERSCDATHESEVIPVEVFVEVGFERIKGKPENGSFT